MKKSDKKSGTKKSEKILRKKKRKERKRRQRLEVFLEFFIFGLIMGIIEDLIAINFATGETITWEVVGIIALVALPFAAIGELFIDRIRLLPKKKKK